MMATSMPVVATTHSDIPYIFGKHSDLLVSERNALAIADKLQSYAQNPDSLVDDGTLLRKRICEEFDVRQCAAHLSDIYDSTP
jgi:glycosyltransferase involved in cell wall biosynthesis